MQIIIFSEFLSVMKTFTKNLGNFHNLMKTGILSLYNETFGEKRKFHYLAKVVHNSLLKGE